MLKFNVMDLFEGRLAPEVEKVFSSAKKPFLMPLVPVPKELEESDGVVAREE